MSWAKKPAVVAASEPFDPGQRPDLKWLPVARLSVDHRYQRTLESKRSQALVDAIAARFNWSAFQAVLATEQAFWGGVAGHRRPASGRGGASARHQGSTGRGG